MPETEQGSASQQGARFALEPVSLRDLLLIGVLLAVAIVTFPFAFECCVVLIVMFPSLRDALARAQYLWTGLVIAALAVLAVSDEALRFILHHNVFALFSNQEFLASRLAQIIERVALLLSFSCLLLLGRMAALYRRAIPKLDISRVRTAIAYVCLPGILLIKWNHFVLPISFLHTQSVGWAGFSVTDPNPTTLLMAPILAALSLGAGSILVFVVLAIKPTRQREVGDDD